MEMRLRFDFQQYLDDLWAALSSGLSSGKSTSLRIGAASFSRFSWTLLMLALFFKRSFLVCNSSSLDALSWSLDLVKALSWSLAALESAASDESSFPGGGRASTKRTVPEKDWRSNSDFVFLTDILWPEMRNTPIMYYVRMRISASACVFMLVNIIFDLGER